MQICKILGGCKENERLGCKERKRESLIEREKKEGYSIGTNPSIAMCPQEEICVFHYQRGREKKTRMDKT